MYSISPNIDKNKVFIVNRSELEGKLEVAYYNPDIRAIENTIKAKSSKSLKDFIEKIASGATPSIAESQKYYSDKENGIPFLRVQNLSADGKLKLKDVKYISQETHNKDLKRSQVGGGDLLVKITGVGRMAIASVADDDFVGNTNQHMVVIKTKNKPTSEYLAKYLNLDIVEKLATRRATGGTRPALDYTALKSIPIIEDIDFSLLDEAYTNKQKKEQEAKEVLASIDSYLLNELGITLPDKDTSLQNRVFNVNFSEVLGGRFDPDYNQEYYFSLFTRMSKQYEKKKLSEISIDIFQGVGRDLVETSDFILLKVKNIEKGNKIKFDDVEFIKNVPPNKVLKNNDIISPFIGEAIRQIKFSIFKEKTKLYTVDNNTGVIRIDENLSLPNFVCEVLNSKLGEVQILRLLGGGGVPFLGSNSVSQIVIPLPPLEIQNEIAAHISSLRATAKQLQQDAEAGLERAKKEIEQLILGAK